MRPEAAISVESWFFRVNVATGERQLISEAWTINPDELDVRQITHSERDLTHSFWSPDGTRIACGAQGHRTAL